VPSFDPGAASIVDFYRLLIGCVIPRPIAFVSTLSVDGVPNLAPFSFFTVASANPPVVCFAPQVPGRGLRQKKDTLRNVEDTGEFVVNIVSEDFAAQMNLCSGDYPPEVDEFAISGLTPVASESVRPARVGESRVQMECKLREIIRVSDAPLGGSLVMGNVLRMHVAEEVLRAGAVDPDLLRAIGRMGGSSYTRTQDRFDMKRP